MSTNSPSREVSHDPRDIKQAPRKSSRLRNKDKERKQTSRGSVSFQRVQGTKDYQIIIIIREIQISNPSHP